MEKLIILGILALVIASAIAVADDFVIYEKVYSIKKITNIPMWSGNESVCIASPSLTSGGWWGYPSTVYKTACENPLVINITIPESIKLEDVAYLKLRFTVKGVPTRLHFWLNLRNCTRKEEEIKVGEWCVWWYCYPLYRKKYTVTCESDSYAKFGSPKKEVSWYWTWMEGKTEGTAILDISDLKTRKISIAIAQEPSWQSSGWGYGNLVKLIKEIQLDILAYYKIKPPKVPESFPPYEKLAAMKLWKVASDLFKVKAMAVYGPEQVYAGKTVSYDINLSVDEKKYDRFWKDGNYDYLFGNWVVFDKQGNIVAHGNYKEINDSYVDRASFKAPGQEFAIVAYILKYSVEYDYKNELWNPKEYEVVSASGAKSGVIKTFTYCVKEFFYKLFEYLKKFFEKLLK